eukprot:1748311-Rhodomonas_salina.2
MAAPSYDQNLPQGLDHHSLVQIYPETARVFSPNCTGHAGAVSVLYQPREARYWRSVYGATRVLGGVRY